MKQLLSVLVLAWATPLVAAQGAFLGVELDGSSESGARIHAVQDSTAAALMGLQAGDVIVAVGEQRIADANGLVRTMGTFLPGDFIEVRVLRGTEEVVVPVILGRRPEDRTIYQPLIPQGRGFQWDYSDILPQQQLTPWITIPGETIELPFTQPLVEDWMSLPGAAIDWPQLPELLEIPEYPGLIEIPDLQELSGKQIFAPNSEWLERVESMRDRMRIFSDGLPIDGRAPIQFGGGKSEITVTYPESTPAAERQQLIDQAVADYGEEVIVRFEGTGTSISIQKTVSSSSGPDGPQQPEPPTLPTPPSGKGSEF